ncbi:MAG TPA: hypothetical protein VLH86_00930 [Patescibacteria group bacterium]|nr:hypothetical protein [Patescibacteria group bacterium]
MSRRYIRPLMVITGLAVAGFLFGYGVIANAWPVHGRQPYHGYFTNTYDDQGTFVLPNKYSGGWAIPTSTNSPGPFISQIKNDLASGSTQEKTGAAFIIQTMIGNATNKPPTAAQVADWEDRVNDASISWNINYCYTINSYYQGTSSGPNPADDAFYSNSGCAPAIVFRDSSGAIVYAIRRQCANPVGNGNIGSLEKRNNFNMTGRTTVSNASPKPGQSVTFHHYVKNNGPDSASAVWWATFNASTGGGLASGGPNSYAAGQEINVNNETFTVPAGTLPNTQYCRNVGYDPINGAGARNGRGAVVCAKVPYDFGLTPSINIVVNGTAPTSSFAEVGDKIDFVYSVNNVGTTVSMTTTCTINGKAYNGYRTVPAPPDSSSDPGYVPPATGCPRTFPLNSNTTLATETIASVPGTSANKTLCRALSVNPSSPTTGAKATEVCISIANKPYLRVYGGDVSVGNGFSTSPGTCVSNNQAAVVGWNNESPTFSGAGAQFATYALSKIYDSATALGNTGGAPAGSGLAFGNKTPLGGTFGGNFGTVPCASDYYGTKGTTTNTASPVNVATLATGSYTGTAPAGQAVQIGGQLPGGGRKVVVYVNGNVLITGNIKYPGAWTADQPPMFELIAKGNIYISQNVTQLDGIYVAQPSGAAGGIIYTCANPGLPATAVTTTGGNVFTNCKNQLIINGSFVSTSVQFLRVNGTLRQSSAGEKGDATGHAAEVFNYSPALWMAMPPGSSTMNDYDSITSLPPIL